MIRCIFLFDAYALLSTCVAEDEPDGNPPPANTGTSNQSMGNVSSSNSIVPVSSSYTEHRLAHCL